MKETTRYIKQKVEDESIFKFTLSDVYPTIYIELIKDILKSLNLLIVIFILLSQSEYATMYNFIVLFSYIIISMSVYHLIFLKIIKIE